jgi:hypothetical protein
VGAGYHGVVEHVDGRAELLPEGGAPRWVHVLHVSSFRDGYSTYPQAHSGLLLVFLLQQLEVDVTLQVFPNSLLLCV